MLIKKQCHVAVHIVGAGCSGRKLDIAILGDRSRSLEPRHLRTLRKAIYNIVNRLGVSPAGNHFGMIHLN